MLAGMRGLYSSGCLCCLQLLVKEEVTSGVQPQHVYLVVRTIVSAQEMPVYYLHSFPGTSESVSVEPAYSGHPQSSTIDRWISSSDHTEVHCSYCHKSFTTVATMRLQPQHGAMLACNVLCPFHVNYG